MARGAVGKQQWACLVRLHDPTAPALERILDWTRELAGSPFALWVSIDTTCYGDAPLKALEAAIDERAERCGVRMPGPLVHAYHEDDMLALYPALSEIRSSNRSLAWGLHAEAVNLWFCTLAQPYRQVWVIEDDVGCTGSLAELLGSYQCVDVDLLVAAEPCAPEVGWQWLHAATAGFKEAVGSRRLKVPEMVLRVSRRLLTTLHRWSIEGRSSWSEMAWASVARQEPGLTVDILLAEHIGSPFCHDGDVARPDFERERTSPLGKPPTFMHALKFGLRPRQLEGMAKPGCDADLCAGTYYCEYAATQWRRWSAVVILNDRGRFSNGWDFGNWYSSHDESSHGVEHVLLLDWDRWPADVLRTGDEGQTWTAEIPCHGSCSGWARLRRTSHADPGHSVAGPVGVYTLVSGATWETAPLRLEELWLQRGGVAGTASGRRGSWSLDDGGLTLTLAWETADAQQVVLKTRDGGCSWLSAGTWLARRSGQTGESAAAICSVCTPGVSSVASETAAAAQVPEIADNDLWEIAD